MSSRKGQGLEGGWHCFYRQQPAPILWVVAEAVAQLRELPLERSEAWTSDRVPKHEHECWDHPPMQHPSSDERPWISFA